MTEKNFLGKRIHIFCRTLLTASLCAGLLLSGCGSKQPREQQKEPGSNTGSAAVTASTEEKASPGNTAGQDSAAAASTEAAAAATTGEQFADPDWTPGSGEGSGFSAKGKGLVIVLDPGHASQVPGTMEPVGPGAAEMKEADTVGTFGPSSGLHEYDLTMDVTQKLRAELEERGYEVKLTHHDTFNPISCIERAAVANENEADAFIRIHANGSENTEANGAMTICITEENPYHPELYSASVRLSEILLDTYCQQTGTNREYVWETDTMTGNNWAEVPTSLIELGYMTNPDEDLKMNQDSFQKVMCNAIADALDKWFGEMPEDELPMHPSLTGESTDSADTSTTARASGDNTSEDVPETDDSISDAPETDDSNSEAPETDDSISDAPETDESTSDTADGDDRSGEEESAQDNAAPAAATPTGASSGNGTGVSTDTGSNFH